MSILSVAVCLLVVLHTSDAVFTWLQSKDEVRFKEGETAKLFWSVDVGSGKSWVRVDISRNSIAALQGDEDIISVLQSTGQKTVQLQVRAADLDLVVNGPSNIVNVTFTLRNLARNTDDMYYIVKVLRNGDFISDIKSTKLIVLVLPGTSTFQVEPAGPSCQDKHVNLTCNTTVGNPADTTLTFYRNNQVVKTVSGTLNGNEAKATVTIAMKAGVNSFTCTANNSAGTSQNSTAVNITAKEPPVITSCTNNTAVEGTNLVWTCTATGSQTLTFSWFKENNNTAITSGNTLNKTSIKRADAGMYRFTVSNGDECPTASTTVYLTVQFFPDIPTIQVEPVQSLSCKGKHVNLTCNTTVGNPEDTTLTFYRNNQVVKTVSGTLNGSDAKATVTIAVKAGVNSFTCAANNLAGTSESSAAVNITAEPPVITSCTNKTAVNGTNLVWTCNATGSQPLTFSWFKDNNNTVNASGNTLNIAFIKRSDGGMYRFTVSNGDECPSNYSASKTVYLTVQYPPNITYPQGPDCKPLPVNENQDATLVCRADGKPTPTITWTKDGVPLSKQGSPLVLQNVVRNQAGNYTCTADNGVGNDTACWKLVVKYKPEQMQIVNTQGGFMDVDEGQPINITCKAKGNPHPYYHWTHHSVSRDSEVNNTIIIKQAVLGDAGVYVCTAVNDVGSSNITVTLRVNYIRNATCDVTPNPAKQGDTIQFSCSAAGYPPVNYAWTSGGEQEPSTTVKATLSLSGVTLTCKATNRLGTRTCSRTIHYTWSGNLKITGIEFNSNLQVENSSEFKKLKEQFEAMFNQTYENSTDIGDPKVTKFSKGSVIVDYQLTLTANVSDPSLPLKQALNSSGGILNGLEIDYSSIQAGVYVPPPTTTTPAPTTGPPTAVPVTPEPTITIGTIIGIVVGAVAFIIIIVLIVCCCKKKKAKKSSRNGSWNIAEDENNVGIDNRGASSSPSRYARHGPHPSTSTQPTNNNQDNNDIAPTYAQVDINKKTSKKNSGELMYADLLEFQQSGSETHGKGGIQLEPLPKDKVKMPPKYEESEYAEIVGFQKAREEKKADSSDNQDTETDEKPKSEETDEKERKEVTPPNQPSSSQSTETPNSEDTAERGQEATASSQTSVDSLFTRDRNGTTLTTVSL